MSRQKKELKHVAIIMDGNGRWAKARNMPRFYGHREGVESAKNAVEFAYETDIRYLTLFAFSTENWNRPKEEIDAIMDLMAEYIDSYVPKLKKRNIRLKVIGNNRYYSDSIKEKLDWAVKQLEDNKGMVLSVAFSYGGREEIIASVNKLLKSGVKNVTEEILKKNLYTYDIPDPDLLIRTGGEKRISNFLLFQLAYTELYFADILWPDFGKDEFRVAVEEYNKRDRRFGKVK